MKNKICMNAKYFSKSKVDSATGHVMRLFAENTNSINERLHLNFGTPDVNISNRYEKSISKMKGVKEKSNTLIDCVLVFPLEQWEEANMSREEVHEAIVGILRDIEEETGLTPCGYKMHLDEGHYDENDKFIMNPHAHLIFANACTVERKIKKEVSVIKRDENDLPMRDPNKPSKWLYETDESGQIKKETREIDVTNKMPLQHLQGRGRNSVWSKMQDIAAHRLEAYGFERGESMELTGRKHKEKHDYVAKALKDKEKELVELRQTIKREQGVFQNFIKSLVEFQQKALNRNIGTRERIDAAIKVREEMNKLKTDEAKDTAEKSVEATVESIEGSFVGKLDPEIKATLALKEKKEREARIKAENSKKADRDPDKIKL